MDRQELTELQARVEKGAKLNAIIRNLENLLDYTKGSYKAGVILYASEHSSMPSLLRVDDLTSTELMKCIRPALIATVEAKLESAKEALKKL